ncbi:MAG: hypothetical protein ABMB14_25310, partial [Myxococcota bacterium]
GVIPSIGEMLLPECWSCPVCTAGEGERCDPDCYAGWDRATYHYVPEDVGKRLLEGNRRARLARAAAAAATDRHAPVEQVVAVEAELKRPAKRRKARR